MRTIRIRRSWVEESVMVALLLAGAAYMVLKFDNIHLLWLYAAWLVPNLVINRRQGIELTDTTAIIRRPFRRTVRLARAELAEVSIVSLQAVRVVGLRATGGKVVSLSIHQALGRWGNGRLQRTHEAIRCWWLARPAAALPAAALSAAALPAAQLPGSASI